MSHPKGTHGDLDKCLEILKTWPGGEAAFGGGNILVHPDLLPFLTRVKFETNIIANITVNQFHLRPDWDLLKVLVDSDLVKGVGVSIIDDDLEYVKKLATKTSNMVFHIIAGVHSVEQVKELARKFDNPKILILGYKEFGNGVGYKKTHSESVTQKLQTWFWRLHEMFQPGYNISFDNLAIEQLRVQRFFNESAWQEFFQKEDGFANLYADMVKEEFAVSSRSPVRHKLLPTIKEMFETVRVK